MPLLAVSGILLFMWSQERRHRHLDAEREVLALTAEFLPITRITCFIFLTLQTLRFPHPIRFISSLSYLYKSITLNQPYFTWIRFFRFRISCSISKSHDVMDISGNLNYLNMCTNQYISRNLGEINPNNTTNPTKEICNVVDWAIYIQRPSI